MPFSASTPLNRLALWLALGAVSAALLSWLLPVLSPFVVAAVMAYVLHPVVLRLQKWLGGPRTLHVLLVEICAIAALLGVGLLLVPVLLREWPILQAQWPKLLDQAVQALDRLAQTMGLSLQIDAKGLREQLVQYLSDNREDWLAPLLTSLKLGGSAALALLGHVVLVPVVLFYLLHDWERVGHAVQELVPPHWRPGFDSFMGECDAVLGEYLRGQLMVMLVLAAGYGLGLWAFGLDLAWPIGVFTGLAVMVPYLGFGLGLVLALLAGLLQFDPGHALLMVTVVYGAGQLLESLYLTPTLVGERIGLHPLAVILALLAFGQLLGFVGILMALPASAVLLVALRRLRQHYLGSALYHRTGAGHHRPGDAP